MIKLGRNQVIKGLVYQGLSWGIELYMALRAKGGMSLGAKGPKSWVILKGHNKWANRALKHWRRFHSTLVWILLPIPRLNLFNINTIIYMFTLWSLNLANHFSFNHKTPSCFRPSCERLATHVLPHPHSAHGGHVPLRRLVPGSSHHGQPQALQAQQRPRAVQRRSSHL